MKVTDEHLCCRVELSLRGLWHIADCREVLI